MISQLYIDQGRYSNTDALSRLPCQQCGRQQHKLEEEAPVNIITGNIHSLIGKSLQQLKELQVQDTHIGPETANGNSYVLVVREMDGGISDQESGGSYCGSETSG